MGIRFSPGCECCGNKYLCICKPVSLPIIGPPPKGQYIQFSVGEGANVTVLSGPFVDPKTTAVLATDPDLLNDAVGINGGAIFLNAPGGLTLPLDPNTLKLTTEQGLKQSIGIFSFEITQGQVEFFADVFVQTAGTFQFAFCRCEGSKGGWDIISGKLTSGISTISTVATFIFNVDANGNIT